MRVTVEGPDGKIEVEMAAEDLRHFAIDSAGEFRRFVEGLRAPSWFGREYDDKRPGFRGSLKTESVFGTDPGAA